MRLSRFSFQRPIGRFISPSAILAALLLALVPGFTLSAQHGAAAPTGKPFVEVNLEQHLEIKDLKKAMPPQIRGNTILFTFRETSLASGAAFTNSTRQTTAESSLDVKRVSIAFAHEGWRTLHPLTKTNLPHEAVVHTAGGGGGHGGEGGGATNPALMWEEPPHPVGPPVFYIYYEIDRHVQEELIHLGKNLEYRFVVDGVWMADPLNTSNLRKVNGSLVSFVDLSRIAPPAVISPEIHVPPTPSAATLVRQRPEQATLTALASSRQARTVILRWVGAPGQEVFVAGTFNQFDPWLNPLEAAGSDPRNPGKTVYEVELRLLAGQYQYHFVINGQPYLDTLNSRRGFDAQGTKYSQVLVP